MATCTPRKIDVEPKNQLFEEETHLNQTFIFGFHVNFVFLVLGNCFIYNDLPTLYNTSTGVFLGKLACESIGTGIFGAEFGLFDTMRLRKKG